MLSYLRILGHHWVDAIATVGRAGRIWRLAIYRKPSFKNVPLVIDQIYRLGVMSVVITMMSGFSIDAVLALQGYNQLARYGSESSLRLGVALVLVMEIGPVVSALLFAGRAGSAATAEIGLMKATEQLSSMEMMGVDPLQRIISPRLWTGFIVMPILAALFREVGIFGASLVAIEWLGVYEGAFWSVMQEGVDFSSHVAKGIVKWIVFGLMVTWIAVFEGYDCQPTSEGIAATTTLTVVYSSVSTLVLDFFLTVIMFKLHRLIMQHRSIEIVVGAFILAGVLSVAILAVRVSGFNVGSDAPTYRVTAHFENVGGLVVWSKVSISGVVVGRVVGIRFDLETFTALVEIELDAAVSQISTDTTAAILTDGLLGGKYIGLSLGAEEEFLGDGSEIYDTQSAIVLEELIGQFLLKQFWAFWEPSDAVFSYF